MLSPLVHLQNISPNERDTQKLWQLADIALSLGRISQSINCAYTASQLDNTQQERYRDYYLKAMRLGAELAEETRNHFLAEHYWQQLTKYVPNNVEFWYGLAIAQGNLEKYLDAEKSAIQGLKYDPQHQKLRAFLQEIRNYRNPV